MEEDWAGRHEGAEVVREEAGLQLTGRQRTEGFLPGDAMLGEMNQSRRPNAARSRFREATKAGGVAEAERTAGAVGDWGPSSAAGPSAEMGRARSQRRALQTRSGQVAVRCHHAHAHTHAHATGRLREALLVLCLNTFAEA